jgi:methionyl-tRNA formyltransferase
LRIVFFGTPDFAVPSLNVLLGSGEDVAAVVTQPDRLKGRGHKLAQPPVKELALSKGIPVLQPGGIRSPEFLSELAEFRPEAIVVVAYGKIIPPPILKLPPLGCINVHASLLPRYRGAAPIQWAIISGETRTGVTTMMMDEGLDTGDILLRDETHIADDDNAVTLGRRLSEMGAALLRETLAGVRDGSVKPVPQSGEPSFAPPLRKEDGRIGWELPARKICDLVRGTYLWPGAYCFLGGEKIGVLLAAVVNERRGGVAGTIEKIAEEGISVSCGQGVILLREVKPEGKKAMPAAAFARGRKVREGTVFDV